MQPLTLSKTFAKRSFTFNSFIQAIAGVLRQAHGILRTMCSRLVSRSAAERIMLAVTGVNGCRYCSFAHAKRALDAGCSPEEVECLLQQDIQGAPETERIALLFAQHFAETGGKPTHETLRRLTETYGVGQAQAILHYIQLITIGNLAGNTIDAFRSRLAGVPSPAGSFWFECIFFLASAPFVRFLF